MYPLPPRQHMSTGQSNSVSQVYHGVGKREINEALLGKTAFYQKPMKEGNPRNESLEIKFERAGGNANNLLKKSTIKLFQKATLPLLEKLQVR